MPIPQPQADSKTEQEAPAQQETLPAESASAEQSSGLIVPAANTVQAPAPAVPAVIKPGRIIDPSLQAIFGDDNDFGMMTEGLMENVDDLDIRISRFAFLQPLSPEVASKTAGYTDGQIIDNVTRQIYSVYDKPEWLKNIPGIDWAAQQKVHFLRLIPVCVLPKEYARWKTKDEGGGMDWKSLDPNEDRVRDGMWKNRGGRWVPPPPPAKQSPPVTENINILSLVVDDKWNIMSSYVCATFNRTSYKAGRFLINNLADHRTKKMPPWGRMYYLYTTMLTKDRNTWWEARIQPGQYFNDSKDHLENKQRLHLQCIDIGRELTDPTPSEKDTTISKGRQAQLLYINSVQDVADDAGTDYSGDEENTLDGTVTPTGNEPTF